MVVLMSERRPPEIRAGAEERRTLGLRLREARKAAGLTLERSAELLRVSAQSIWRWEAGATFPTTDRLEKAADLYGVSLDWLMGKEKRIGETPELYYPGEAPPTDEEMRLAMEFIRVLRRQRHKHADPPTGAEPPG